MTRRLISHLIVIVMYDSPSLLFSWWFSLLLLWDFSLLLLWKLFVGDTYFMKLGFTFDPHSIRLILVWTSVFESLFWWSISVSILSLYFGLLFWTSVCYCSLCLTVCSFNLLSPFRFGRLSTITLLCWYMSLLYFY